MLKRVKRSYIILTFGEGIMTAAPNVFKIKLEFYVL